MKRPNGSGGVRKLSGKRRHPWQAVVSAGHEIRHGEYCVKQRSLGCYSTRKEALEALAEWQANHINADMRSMTVDDVWNKVYPNLKDSMKRILLIDVKTYDIEQIPLPPLSSSSHDKIRALWHRLYEYGIANDIVMKDYSVYIKFNDTIPQKKKEIFTEDEIKSVIGIPVFRFLLYTGMRINELLSMKMEQVYEENGVLCFHIDKSKTQAGIRVIPVHSELMDYLGDGEYVIEPHHTYTFYRYQLMEINKDHTLHDFRRTFASYAKSGGADDYYIKRLMGHISDDITKDIYTQAFIKDLKDAIEKVQFK